jgi:DUF971 family protein
LFQSPMRPYWIARRYRHEPIWSIELRSVSSRPQTKVWKSYSRGPLTLHCPTEINHVKADGRVRITWDDGHVGEYPEEYLRGYCPCALCQGHGAQRNFVPVSDAKLGEIRLVGNYAIEFRWQDGHSTGIYTYDYLRSLCPCRNCKEG